MQSLVTRKLRKHDNPGLFQPDGNKRAKAFQKSIIRHNVRMTDEMFLKIAADNMESIEKGRSLDCRKWAQLSEGERTVIIAAAKRDLCAYMDEHGDAPGFYASAELCGRVGETAAKLGIRLKRKNVLRHLMNVMPRMKRAQAGSP
ncbi:MAG: hypothetical protein LBU26_01860 [Synergistaceae bacterium]|jgi:hypothetical protein|nr:hypothetical protein [Synergistaceae bacterium]